MKKYGIAFGLAAALLIVVGCMGENENKAKIAIDEARRATEEKLLAAQNCEDALDKSEDRLRDLQRQVSASFPVQLANAQVDPETLNKLPPELRDELAQKLAIFQSEVKRELDFLIAQNKELKSQIIRSGEKVEDAIQKQTVVLDTADTQRFEALDGQLRAIEEATRLRAEQQQKIGLQVEEVVVMMREFDAKASQWFLGTRKDDILRFHAAVLERFIKMQKTLRELQEAKE